MPLEAASFINQLNTSNPQGSDFLSEGDNHLRLLKLVLRNSFPSVGGAVSATDVELSRVAGVTAPIQTQLDAKAAVVSPNLTGTPTVPTATIGTNSGQAASTAFVQAAIASVNAQTSLVLSVDNSASIPVYDGLHILCTNPAAVEFVFPIAPVFGGENRITVGNGRSDNYITLGGAKVNGEVQSGDVLILDDPFASITCRWTGADFGWSI